MGDNQAAVSASAGKSTYSYSLLSVIFCSLSHGFNIYWGLGIGLVDFYGQAAFAHGFAVNAAWPATPYYPAGYPLLLAPFGLLGDVLLGGHVLALLGYCLMLISVRRLGIAFGFTDLPVSGLLALVYWDNIISHSFKSPAVDSLFTGLSLLFVSTAIAAWNKPEESIAPWASTTLIVCSALLPLLRYHGLLVVVPLLLVMLIFRPYLRRAATLSLSACLLALLLNGGIYYLQYGRGLETAAGLQLRCGLEFDLLKHYESPDALFYDYINFANHSRETPLLEDYTVAELASHTLNTYSLFMRRPAILLSAVLFILLLLLRRSLPRSAGLLLLWVALYCLALSPAYYTDRAAILPIVLCYVLAFVLLSHLASGRTLINFVAITIGLLWIGMIFTGESVYNEHILRKKSAHGSRMISEKLSSFGIHHSRVASSDIWLRPVVDNPWCEPYVALQLSWLDDPLIFPEQKPGLRRTSPAEIVSGTSGLDKLVVSIDSEGSIPEYLVDYSTALGVPHNQGSPKNVLVILSVPQEGKESEGEPAYIKLRESFF